MDKITVGICYTKNSPNAIAACDAFAEGVEAAGDSHIKVLSERTVRLLSRCDISVQVCDYNKHCGTDFRYHISRIQKVQNKRRIVIDTGFIKNKRSDENDLNRYMQIGYDGIKRNAKCYNQNSSQDRWKALEIPMKDWREEGEHILILGQHEIGISTQHVDVVDWWEDVISRLGSVTKKTIKFRPHPNQTKFPKGNYELTTGKTMEEDLSNCWCAVARTTNGAVDAIINGVPVFTPDEACMAYCVASHQLLKVENPVTPDRTQWAANLAYAQWSIEEMKQGLPWKHLRRFLND